MDIDTTYHYGNFLAKLVRYYVWHHPSRWWVLVALRWAQALHFSHLMDEKQFAQRVWSLLLRDEQFESRVAGLIARMKARNQGETKPTTVIGAVPQSLLAQWFPAVTVIGLKLDVTGQSQADYRTIASELLLSGQTFLVSPHFYRTYLRRKKAARRVTIVANGHEFGSFRQFLLRSWWFNLRDIIALTGFGAIIGVLSIQIGGTAYNAEMTENVLADVPTLLLNILPVIVLMLFGYGLFNRLLPALLVGALPAFGIALVNLFMLRYRNYPFAVSDLSLIAEAGNMGGHYSYLPPAIVSLEIGGVLLAMFLIAHFCRPLPNGWLRRTAGLLFLTVLTGLGLNHYYLSPEYAPKAVDTTLGSPYNDADVYVTRGVLFSFLRSTNDDRLVAPPGYSEKRALALLKRYQNHAIEPDQRLNVLTIQLEAFQDFSKWADNGVDIDSSVYGGFHEVQAEGLAGEISTTVFGGGTIDTERKVLTGYSTINTFAQDANSFVRYFNQQGYETRFMHPSVGWFYNRENIDKYLGFQTRQFAENYYDKNVSDATIVPDSAVFTDLVDQLRQVTAKGQSLFSQTITMQNHGPYASEYGKTPLLIMQDEYNEADWAILNNYLSGIKETSDALLALTQTLAEETEPVVLVFWGDHNPWAGDKESAYRMLGINFNQETTEGFSNYYNTPYVMWANPAAQAKMKTKLTGAGPTISPMYVLPELFSRVGWQGSPYLQHLQALRPAIPVFGLNNQFLIDGELTTKLTPAQQKKVSDLETIQYYLKTHYQPD